MTSTPTTKPSSRAAHKSLATLATVATLALASAAVAFAGGGGGIGTGGDGGDGGGDGGSGGRYAKAWDSFSQKDREWARKTSMCESGGDPKIHSPGGTYHGAFQFLASTWKSSPMSPGTNHADNFNWKTQAVVAVKLMHQQGTNPWPNCG